MLTKTDLTQLKKIVKAGLKETVTKKDLKAELKETVTKKDLKRELNPIKSDIAKIRKDIDVIVTMFDREYIDLRKRVEAIEEHLGIQPTSP